MLRVISFLMVYACFFHFHPMESVKVAEEEKQLAALEQEYEKLKKIDEERGSPRRNSIERLRQRLDFIKTEAAHKLKQWAEDQDPQKNQTPPF